MPALRALVAKLTPAPSGRVEETDGVAIAEDDLDPSISYGGHVCLAGTFVVATLAYTILALVAYFTRPETETFLQLPTSQFPPVELDLQVSCNNAPFCGDVIIGANYTGVSTCGSLGTSTDTTAAADLANGGIRATRTLCFTEQQLYSVETKVYIPITGLQVDFKAINPGIDKSTTPHTANESMRASGSVHVSAPTVDADFRRLVNMDTWQVKTLVLGQNVKRRDGVVVSRTLFPISIQYEGKRPNWRATMFIALSPLSNVFDTERPGTLLDVLASVGGATTIITAILFIATPIVGIILPGQAADSSPSADAQATGSADGDNLEADELAEDAPANASEPITRD